MSDGGTRKGQQSERPSGSAPQGDAPGSDAELNKPGMTNGVPDQANDADTTGAPHSERKDTETAGSGRGPRKS